MNNLILVRHIKTRQEVYRHELSLGEKPWEVLQLLMEMDFEIDKTDLEFVMDPERELRELEAEAQRKEGLKNLGKP